MENKYFSEIYDDFFKVSKDVNIEDNNNVEIDYNLEIDNLYLDDESKSLLKHFFANPPGSRDTLSNLFFIKPPV